MPPKKCEHGRRRTLCKDCGGGSICEHGRRRSICKDCGGSGICEHGRQRSTCKDCGGGGLCEHGRRRCVCKECGGGGGHVVILEATAVEEIHEEEGIRQNTSDSATTRGHVPDGEVIEVAAPPEWPADARLTTEESSPEMPCGHTRTRWFNRMQLNFDEHDATLEPYPYYPYPYPIPLPLLPPVPVPVPLPLPILAPLPLDPYSYPYPYQYYYYYYYTEEGASENEGTHSKRRRA